MKLGICVPTRETVDSKFAYCLSQLTARLVSDAIEFELFFEQGSILPQQRTNLSHMAIQRNCDYILFLDSDMVFPANVVDRLLKHNKDMVACNYVTRTAPHRSTAFLDTIDYTNTLPKESGLHQVEAIGLGIALIKTKIFDLMSKPYFIFEWSADFDCYVGEDIYFCKCVRENGYQIWVDTDLSNQCGHSGTKTYSMDDL